ncbi:hypothetical protein [Rhabdothermincola sp.]|uniref:hypothetical protein n=1 Tax=Rhabdothermincola sp. TaxID=2820405 RepID=UPI002FDF3C80
MTSDRSHRLVSLVVLLGIVVGAGVSASGCRDGSGAGRASSRTADGAIDAAVGYLRSELDEIDTVHLAVVDYLSRNWDLEPLRPARDRARSQLDQQVAAQGGMQTVEQQLLRRLIDPDAAAPPPDALPSWTDDSMSSAARAAYPLMRALSCDVSPLTDRDLDAFRALIARGGYDATHVALAIGWISEMGCADAPVEVLRADAVEQIAADLDRGPVEGLDPVNDLSLEQSAMLLYLGARERVPAGWFDEVRARQGPDGGWSAGDGESGSRWHESLLALWTLLQERSTGAEVPMVIAAPRG